MEYFQFTFLQLKKDDEEMLISLLADEATGFQNDDDSFSAFTKNENAFSEILKSFPQLKFSVSHIAEQNWNAQWESSFDPVTIKVNEKPFLHIRASFHKAFKNAAHEIIITPKMSFGTGHHATTALVAENMSAIDFKNKSVIDFGTGTGVLAILAEKCGASEIIAIDNDEWSISNAKENMEINGCSKIELILSDKIETKEPVDIIIANINLNIILSHIEKIQECLKLNGILILSGMLLEDSNTISEALQQKKIEVKKIQDQNNWIMVLAVKRLRNNNTAFSLFLKD